MPYGEGATYQPLRDLLTDAFGDADLVRSIRKTLKGDENANRIAEFLVGAVSAASSAPTSGDTQFAVRRLLEALARKKPLLVVLEDVHWAEPTFLDLVDYVAGWSEDAPLVLLSLDAARTARREAVLGQRRTRWRPLSREDAVTLVRELAEGQGLGEEAFADVLDTAEGNPLFIEQLVAAAAEQDLAPGPNPGLARGAARKPPRPPLVRRARGARARGDRRP